MKKIIAFTLIIISIFTLASCSIFDQGENNNDNNSGSSGNSETRGKIRVGYLTGPTGMGMAKLIIDNNGLDGGNQYYEFKKYADTTAAKADLAAGKVDVICLPTNEAAMYQANVDADAKLLAVNCLNSLFVISSVSTDEEAINTLEDLEGKTIYTCKNGTPRVVIEYILKELGINAEVSYTVDGKDMVTPADVSAQVMAGNIPNAVLPEPLISTIEITTGASSQLGSVYLRCIDLSDEWAKINETPITMGCLVANGEFAKNNKYTLNAFLDEYKASVEFIGNPENINSAADYIQKTTILPKLPVALSALRGLEGSIAYIDGEEMKNALVNFYSAIGVSLPAESFYYEK